MRTCTHRGQFASFRRFLHQASATSQSTSSNLTPVLSAEAWHLSVSDFAPQEAVLSAFTVVCAIVQIGAGAARLLQGSSQIKKLNLSESDLGDEGASQLSAMLTACVHTNLQELELLGCNIGHTGLSRLFQVLQGFAAPALEVPLIPTPPKLIRCSLLVALPALRHVSRDTVCTPCQHIVLTISPSLQVLLLAGNPGVDHAEFSGEVDVLSITRTDLDVVWRGACDAPPTAVDGGPPRPVNTQNWADEPEATEN